MTAWTVSSLLETAAGYLREKDSGSPRLDAEILLAETLGIERIELYTHHDRPLSTAEVEAFRALVARRARHEPVAYIVGRSHFRRLTLEVSPAVLIPRPETEELIDLALESLRLRPPWEISAPPMASPGTAHPAADMEAIQSEDGCALPTSRPLVVDVGTGSGAIAIALAQEDQVRVLGVDSSPEALIVAARNKAAAGLGDLIDLMEADLLSDVAEGSVRLVLSNPPYVTSAEMEALSPDVRLYEPRAALHGGTDGLDVYRRLLPDAARVLAAGGTVLLEVGHEQAAAVRGLAREAGFVRSMVHRDLSGKERFVEAILPGAPICPLSGLGQDALAALSSALEAGAVVGLPTDTVYGLAARWDSTPGVHRLFAAKGRGLAQPVAALFASVRSVAEALPDLHDTVRRVMDALLPGPFTFVVGTTVARPPLVGTEDSLGVRVPDHPGLLALLSRLGIGVAATSANPSGGDDAAGLSEVDPALLAHCSLALCDDSEGGRVRPVGNPSTVVDLRPLVTGGSPVVLREGAVLATEVLGRIARII